MQIPSFVPHYNLLSLLEVANGHFEGKKFVFDLSPKENEERANILAEFEGLFDARGAWIVPWVKNTPHVPWRKVLRLLDEAALRFLRKTCVKQGRFWVLPKNRLTLPRRG